jgi:hypothetical protein
METSKSYKTFGAFAGVGATYLLIGLIGMAVTKPKKVVRVRTYKAKTEEEPLTPPTEDKEEQHTSPTDA